MTGGFHTGDNFTMIGHNTVNKGDGAPTPPPTSNLVWTDPLVFINYRSQDERPAADIESAFTHSLGRDVTFRDVHMRAGTDFPRELADRAARCTVMVSIIGEHWDDPHGLTLLHDPNDWVRRELTTALANRVTVVPIMIGARPRLSAHDLPEDIRAIAYLQAPHLPRSYEPHDVQRLVHNLLKDVPELATAAYRHQ